MINTAQAIVLFVLRGMKKTERVACLQVCVGHLKERDSLEERVVDEKIVLKLILRRKDSRA